MSRTSRRTLAAVAVIVVALPAIALASDKKMSAKLPGDGHLSLVARINDREAKAVHDVSWSVKMHCQHGSLTYKNGLGFRLHVSKREFEGKGASADGKVRSHIVGKFFDRSRKVKGYLRVTGSFPSENLHKCGSGKDHFVLRRDSNDGHSRVFHR